MSLDLTGITNRNEFFTNYYLSAVLEQDLKERIQNWAQDEQRKPPYEQLNALHREFSLLENTLQGSRYTTADDVLKESSGFVCHLLNALGYDYRPTLKDAEAKSIPVVAEVVKEDGTPWLWAIVTAISANDDGNDPLESNFSAGQFAEEIDEKRKNLVDSLEAIISRDIFGMSEPPRWILALHYDYIILVDRAKWNDKRMLSFNLREIMNLRNASNLKVVTALLHKDCLCPNSGSPLLDVLDENSHRHAFAVSEDLKYAAREAVELIANEAIWYIREKQKKAVFSTDDDLAARLTSESLRYLYRLLFLFYLEARAERHSTLPIKNAVYRTGYSLESLRDLELVNLATPEMQNGYFFDESISMLFRMIANGVRPKCMDDALFHTALHNEFSIEKIESHLFDDKLTPTLKSIRLRNIVWQRVICLLSLTKERSGNRRRGRVSYAQLGIIQLGAVYEGLLSYRGFFAKEDLYEVKKAGENRNELEQAFFVNETQLADYSDEERCFDERGNLIKHEKGKFIYRLAGRDRENSASYYTPSSLTKCLVKYALKELIGEKPGDEHYKIADEILTLTICEPAMGSAAFLNEAINQLADAYLRRKQEETGTFIPHSDIEEETQRVRMYLADRNIFGVDLNPVAVELGEISLWLNSMTKASFVPWFGGQLTCGNSLIGARRQVYPTQYKAKQQSWLNSTPKRVAPDAKRPTSSVYHFLVPEEGMASYDDRVIKSMASEKINTIKAWKREFLKPFIAEDVIVLERLSEAIDSLWDAHVKQLRAIRSKTTDRFSIFGHEEGESHNLTLSEKDRSISALYAREVKNSTPYRRLKMVMDYWCALWFWPIEAADELPTRDEYLMELQYILQGTRMQEYGTYDEANGQMLLFPSEERQLQLDFSEELGTVSIDDLCDTFPRLNRVRSIADSQHFLHWELEFADIFHDHGGFDLVLGNPPWVRPDWNEAGLLSDYQPMFAVRNLSATQVSEMRIETLTIFGITKAYFGEYEAMTGTKNYLNAVCNYPALVGMKANLYKCFLPLAWRLNTANGISAFVHPEGVYDDPAGGLLRQEIYSRLRDHFQFSNELRLFADVHHETTFSINVYGAPQETPSFRQLANLYTIATVNESFQNSASPVGGIKDDEGKWNTVGHPDRIIHVGQEELAMFAQLYDDAGTPWNEARLPAIHTRQLISVLEKLAQYPNHFSDVENKYFSTQHWNETTDQTRHTIKRDTQFPSSAEQMVLSGPHFFVGNPIYKTPRAECRLNSDYDTIDLTVLPENYLQRTNYVPDCNGSMEEYRNRTPYCPWDVLEDPVTKQKTILRRVTEYYRIAYRNMIGSASERTMLISVIQPFFAHINTVQSIAPYGCEQFAHINTVSNLTTGENRSDLLLDLAASSYSLEGDFYVKSTGRTHLFWSMLAQLPYIGDDRLRLRVLLLSCLTRPYADLWSGAWRESFKRDGWAKEDPRLPKEVFSQLSSEWSWQTPLRTDYARRQALIEIDVLVAQALGMTLDELCTIYRIQFPVLRQNENDTWYDQTGRIVFTCSKGLPGVGFSRPEWERIRNLHAGDTCPTRPRNLDWLPEEQRSQVPPTIAYQPPFDRCDREADYRTAWEYFSQGEKTGEQK